MKAKTIKEVADLLQIKTDCRNTILGVAADSRLVKPGDLFFALPGAQTDGHHYLSDAASKGALGAVVKKDYTGDDFGLALLRSDDVLNSLQTLSKHHLKSSNAQIIGVTGSLGKTTTKEFISTLLKTRYKVSISPGNSNSQIGLPLSILNHADLSGDILILEMGMTEKGQISRLIEIATPDVAVITMVALVHACYFDSIEEIAQSKAEIFSHPKTRLGIYPLDKDYGKALSSAGSCSKLCFSTQNPHADFYLKPSASEMIIKDAKGNHFLLPPLHLPGEHNQHNFLAAIAVARHFELSWEEIQQGLKMVALPERRLQFIEKFGALFVNDSYNASEMSMKAALNSLPLPKMGGKKIAVLGGMVELGKFSESCHWAVGEHALHCVDLMICFGDDCRPIYECWQAAGRSIIWEKDRPGVVQALRSHLKAGDVVLLKGSRLKGMWKILDEL